MWGLTLNEIANVIILISAVIIAIKTIYQFLKKPVDDLAKHSKDNEEKRIEEVFERKVPGLLDKNCEVIINSLKEIKDMTLNQEERLEKLQASIDLLNTSQLDVLRYNMNCLYYKYRPYKKILDADKQAFIKLYNDYKGMKGNTWIDSLYNEVVEWPIVQSYEELKS